jgi:hypothetical protein
VKNPRANAGPPAIIPSPVTNYQLFQHGVPVHALKKCAGVPAATTHAQACHHGPAGWKCRGISKADSNFAALPIARKAHQALTSTKAADHAPAELTQPRIEHIKARIAELTPQNEREVERYDAAIAELNSELAGFSAKADHGSATGCEPEEKETEEGEEMTCKLRLT